MTAADRCCSIRSKPGRNESGPCCPKSTRLPALIPGLDNRDLRPPSHSPPAARKQVYSAQTQLSGRACLVRQRSRGPRTAYEVVRMFPKLARTFAISGSVAAPVERRQSLAPWRNLISATCGRRTSTVRSDRRRPLRKSANHRAKRPRDPIFGNQVHIA